MIYKEVKNKSIWILCGENAADCDAFVEQDFFNYPNHTIMEGEDSDIRMLETIDPGDFVILYDYEDKCVLYLGKVTSAVVYCEPNCSPGYRLIVDWKEIRKYAYDFHIKGYTEDALLITDHGIRAEWKKIITSEYYKDVPFPELSNYRS